MYANNFYNGMTNEQINEINDMINEQIANSPTAPAALPVTGHQNVYGSETRFAGDGKDLAIDMTIDGSAGFKGQNIDTARSYVTADVKEYYGTGKSTNDSNKTGWFILGRNKGEDLPRATISEILNIIDKDVDNNVRAGRLYYVDVDPKSEADDSQAQRVRVPDAQGIFSPKFGKVVNTPTKKYSVCQTIDACRPFFEEIEAAGIKEVSYNYEERPGAFKMGVWLDQEITPDDGEPCKLGFVLGNDHRGEGAINWAGAGIRLICGNFSMWGYLFGKASYRHTGNITEKLLSFRDFIRNVDFRGVKVLDMINEAHARPLDLKTAETLLATFDTLPEGFRENVFNRFTSAQVLTYYGLYNAMTAELSHPDRKKGSYTFERMNDLGTVCEQVLIDFGQLQVQKAAIKAKRDEAKAKKLQAAAAQVAAQTMITQAQGMQGGQ